MMRGLIPGVGELTFASGDGYTWLGLAIVSSMRHKKPAASLTFINVLGFGRPDLCVIADDFS
jgi:hypothetical protein